MSEPEFIGHSTGPVAGDYFARADSGHRMIFAPTRTGTGWPFFRPRCAAGEGSPLAELECHPDAQPGRGTLNRPPLG